MPDISRYIFDIFTDISDISPIFYRYFRYIGNISTRNCQKKSPTRACHSMPKSRPKYRSLADISAIFLRFFLIFFDFSTERFSIAKIVSLGSDIRYIADISTDISEISNTAYKYIPAICISFIFERVTFCEQKS